MKKTYPVGSRPVKFINQECFAIFDFGAGWVETMVSTFFLFFLTTVILMDPIKAGLILTVSKVWDAITDPAVGYISDRSRSKLGRRSVFILVGAIPSGVLVFLLFHTTHFSAGVSIAWFTIIYLLHSTFWTICNVPANALPNDMTNDAATYAKMVSWRAPHSRIAAMVASYIGPILIYKFGSTPEAMAKGFHVFGIITAVMYTACWLITFAGTWSAEISDEDIDREQKTNLGNIWNEFLSVYKNKAMLQNVFLMVSGYLGVFLHFTYIMYWITICTPFTDRASILTLMPTLGCVVSAFLGGKLIEKFNIGPYYIGSALMYGVGIMVATFFSNSFAPCVVFLFIAGLGMCGVMLAPYQCLPMSIDMDRMITTRRRGGTYTGMCTFTQKVAQAVIAVLLGAILSWCGYDATKAVQDPGTATAILNVFRYGMLVVMLPGMIIAANYKFTMKTHAIIMDACEKLESGVPKESLPDDVKRLSEKLSGWSYDRMWNPENTKLSAPKH